MVPSPPLSRAGCRVTWVSLPQTPSAEPVAHLVSIGIVLLATVAYGCNAGKILDDTFRVHSLPCPRFSAGGNRNPSKPRIPTSLHLELSTALPPSLPQNPGHLTSTGAQLPAESAHHHWLLRCSSESPALHTPCNHSLKPFLPQLLNPTNQPGSAPTSPSMDEWRSLT